MLSQATYQEEINTAAGLKGVDGKAIAISALNLSKSAEAAEADIAGTGIIVRQWVTPGVNIWPVGRKDFYLGACETGGRRNLSTVRFVTSNVAKNRKSVCQQPQGAEGERKKDSKFMAAKSKSSVN